MSERIIHIRLLVVALIWGFGWPAGRIVAQEVEPLTAATLRYLLVIVLFLFYLKATHQWLIPTRHQWKLIFSIAFLSTFLYQVFFMLGVGHTAAGDASLMITFNPLFTSILAIFFLNEHMNRFKIIGVFLGLSGMLILFLDSPNTQIPQGDRWLGNSFIACAALAWAGSSIMMKIAMQDSSRTNDKGLSPLHLTVWASVAGFMILLPLAAIEIFTHPIPTISDQTVISIVFLATFSTVLSYVWFADGILKIGAARASYYVYLVPPFGILGGTILLDEHMSTSLIFAFVLIVGGVMLAQKNDKQSEQSS